MSEIQVQPTNQQKHPKNNNNKNSSNKVAGVTVFHSEPQIIFLTIYLPFIITVINYLLFQLLIIYSVINCYYLLLLFLIVFINTKCLAGLAL